MCIGLPMRVSAVRPGRATVDDDGQGREISTLLVGEVAVGEWLLVHLDAARERVTPERAAEVRATLALVAAALDAQPVPDQPDAFDLPSRLSPDQLKALTGGSTP